MVQRLRYSAILLIAAIVACANAIAAQPDPFASPAAVHVFLFVRTDCPLTNRYAPEIHRIASEFSSRGVDFWIVYPDPAETDAGIAAHMEEYKLPGTPLHDARHELVKRAHASIAPEAAVFDHAGRLEYVGRIDDRFIDFGKARPAPQTHDLEDAITAVLAGKPVAGPRTKAIGCSLADVR